MLVKEFAKEIAVLLHLTPNPVSRNEGHVPTEFKISASDTDVTIAWIQEVMSFGNIYFHTIKITVRETDGKWFFVGPVSGKSEERHSWFPSFVRFAHTGESFDFKKFLSYYRGSEIQFDWSVV